MRDVLKRIVIPSIQKLLTSDRLNPNRIARIYNFLSMFSVIFASEQLLGKVFIFWGMSAGFGVAQVAPGRGLRL